MHLLLDTHIVLWWLSDDPRLAPRAKALIEDPANEVLVSAATAWEIAIKQSLGKLRFDGELPAMVDDQGFTPLSIGLVHAVDSVRLPPIHRDPFDRMLVAQARVENLHLLTADPWVLQYPANTIDCRQP